MSIFDIGSKLTSVVGSAQNAISTVQNAANTVSNLAGALNNLSNPSQLVSAIRSINLPKGGEPGTNGAASASMGGSDGNNDWRVKLTVPPVFLNSRILAPLKNSDGCLIFPYTPTIQLSGSASYDEQPITHQNYQFLFYQHSRAEQITISAPFNVEDGNQALYWLATVHFLRSITKMFTGEDGGNAGNPPPLSKFSGYGEYVFKSIPVIIKGFSVDLAQDVNYINTSSAAAAGGGPGPFNGLGSAATTAGQLAGLAGALGAGKVANALGKASVVGGAIAGLGNLLSGGAGSGSTITAGNSWVPTKSTITVTLQPIYSRTAVRKFSLQKFVSGEYQGKTWV